MRKIKWIMALLVSAFLLTGCGKQENATEVLDASRKKMNELSNYAMKMEMNMGIKAEGMEMTIPVTIDAKIDDKSGISQINTTTSMLGMSFSTEGYTQIVDGKTITYSKGSYELDGEQIWTKETSDQTANYKQFLLITESSSKVEKKKSDDKNADYYQVTISKEKMKSLMAESSNLMGDSMDLGDGYDIQNDVVIGIYVDKESQYITKLSMDLKDVLSIEGMEAGTELTEFNFTLTFSEFDQVGTLTIPEEVITNAQEESDEDWNFDDIDEDSEM